MEIKSVEWDVPLNFADIEFQSYVKRLNADGWVLRASVPLQMSETLSGEIRARVILCTFSRVDPS